MTGNLPEESPYKGNRGIKRIYYAFLNSLNGFKLAYRYESAFRQELILAGVMLIIALGLEVTTVERILLITSVIVVLIIELINSSIEAAIDRISFERHRLSARAKDLGSAAVMLAILLCMMTWSMILSRGL